MFGGRHAPAADASSLPGGECRRGPMIQGPADHLTLLGYANPNPAEFRALGSSPDACNRDNRHGRGNR